MQISLISFYKEITASNVSNDISKVVPLLQFFSVRASVVSYVEFVLSLYVPHLACFWCLEKPLLRDCGIPLRKHAYSNILKILKPKKKKKKKKKKKNFQIKNSDIFHISAQNIVCGYT